MPHGTIIIHVAQNTFKFADINECDDLNDCEQLCMNTEGSYSCSCTMGFDLADDGRKCNGTYQHIYILSMECQ